MTGGGSGSSSSDDCTASANDILKGKTALFNGSDDDIGTGTLELTGSASDGYVYSGMTYYNTDAHTRRTGTMTVGSILNFNAAAYSGRQVLLKWQNPYAATGRPFGGVFINYSTSGYPGTGGTRIYTGYGNNSASGGWSQVIVTLPNLSTTYYFSCTAYTPCSAGDIWGNTMNASCTTANSFIVTITSSQNYTIPEGYSYVDIFCVGGGGGGGANGTYSLNDSYGGAGGGGGYTNTVSNISVSSGQVLYCAIGGGGSGSGSTSYQGGSGGTTYVSRSGGWLCSASGGYGGLSGTNYIGTNGGNGGSGGGGVAFNSSSGAGSGGTNGGNGGGTYHAGTGQGYTTTAFRENWGTVYSGGGGAGGYGYTGRTAQWGGSGGNYGGGAGGQGCWRSGGSSSEPEYTIGTNGYAGTANSGGGGGGAGTTLGSAIHTGGSGGSGVILIRVK